MFGPSLCLIGVYSLVTGGVYSNYVAAFVEQRSKEILRSYPELSNLRVLDYQIVEGLYLCLYGERGGGKLY